MLVALVGNDDRPCNELECKVASPPVGPIGIPMVRAEDGAHSTPIFLSPLSFFTLRDSNCSGLVMGTEVDCEELNRRHFDHVANLTDDHCVVTIDDVDNSEVSVPEPQNHALETTHSDATSPLLARKDSAECY